MSFDHYRTNMKRPNALSATLHVKMTHLRCTARCRILVLCEGRNAVHDICSAQWALETAIPLVRTWCIKLSRTDTVVSDATKSSVPAQWLYSVCALLLVMLHRDALFSRHVVDCGQRIAWAFVIAYRKTRLEDRNPPRISLSDP